MSFNGCDDNGRHVVGIALLPAKAKKHLGPKLIQKAAEMGIEIRPVHVGQPLEEQGPFDVLLHKVRQKEWEEELVRYSARHPAMHIIDSMDAIRPIMSRLSMLAPFGDQGIHLKRPPGGDDREGDEISVAAPQQISISEGCSKEEAKRLLCQANMKPPLLAKPLWADGRDGAHGLAVIHEVDGVEQLVSGEGPRDFRLPATLQQYVEHGGCLFKVFVMGPIVVMARRPSLHIPVPPEDVQDELGHIQTIARISSFQSEMAGTAVLQGDPPQWMVQGLAQELRKRLRLNLFNFDLLRPSADQPGRVPRDANYMVIDINYFPGFEKLPNYETMMVEFLCTLLHSRREAPPALKKLMNCPKKARRPRLSIRAYGFPAPNSSHLEAETLMDFSAVLRQDPEKPSYHVMPSSGWINDPNGPFYYNGKYHLFYQHIINGCEWDFGIVWGHAVSSDLVHWEHLPPALMPTPGGLDADGCFSGCCIADLDGTPTILYTGVRLRSNPDCGALPPQECDLNLPFIESQLIAVPEPDYAGGADPMLANWVKSEEPFLAYPPPDMELVGWRDPFIFEFMSKSGQHKEWGMLMGSGIKGKGGAVMIYRSANLRSGWRYDGMLCEADTVETGAMWECPLLARLQIVPEHARPTHSLLSGFKALSLNSFNNISAFHPKSNPVSPTADRKSLSAETNRQTGFSPPMSVPPRIDGFTAPREDVQNNGARSPPPGGGDSSNGTEAAERSKSLLSEEILNPYGDENGESTDHEASMVRRRQGKDASTSEQASTSGQEQQQQYTHILCISPDAPTNPVLYWLGNFDCVETRFLLDSAQGPLKLDLGDTLYAPNLLEDGEGRHIMWGWLQERRKVGSYDYAGCLSLPRVMYISGNRLHQEPAPEVMNLRRGECWRASQIEIFQEESTPLEGVFGQSVDIMFTLERGSASAAGLLLRSWNAGGDGNAAILVDWERSMLEAVFEGGGALDLATQTDLDPDAEAQRRVGGPVNLKPGEPLTMRVLIDHSCVEIYLSSGEVLSTRVYRGQQPADSDAGIDFVAFGGTAKVEKVEAWEMGSIWQREYIRSSSSYGSVYEPINSVVPVGSPVAV